MSDQTMSYPADVTADLFLLTVRGTVKAASAAQARDLHNATAGNPAGVAAARSLGDLSHNVYLRIGDDHARDLMFLDLWNSLSGMGRFFSDPQVQAGGAAMFAARVNPVWTPLADFGAYHLAVPSGRAPAGLGVIQTRVTALDKAAEAFRGYADITVNDARRSGIVSHTLWLRMPEPGSEGAPEVIGVDVWLDADEMSAYYDKGAGFDRLGPVFDGEPDTSIWRNATGGWTEW
jgi:hypothetical protein